MRIFTHVGAPLSMLTTTQSVVTPAADNFVLYDVKRMPELPPKSGTSCDFFDANDSYDQTVGFYNKIFTPSISVLIIRISLISGSDKWEC